MARPATDRMASNEPDDLAKLQADLKQFVKSMLADPKYAWIRGPGQQSGREPSQAEQRRRRRTEKRYARQLKVLTDRLTRSRRSLSARIQQLIQLGRKMCDDPIWIELSEIPYESGLTCLETWEREVRPRQRRAELEPLDVLSFDVVHDADTGYGLEFCGVTRGVERVSWSEWPQPDVPLLRMIQEVIERHADEMGVREPGADLAHTWFLLACVTLLLGDFLRRQGTLVRACTKTKLVRVVYFGVTAYRIGRLQNGRFTRYSTPLGSGDIGRSTR